MRPDGRCTTRRRNAHRTGNAEEREVLYPWHPWAGCVVHVHEVIEKGAGEVLRCSRNAVDADRWLELPAWMFDRAACLPMRIDDRPRVDVAALSALGALLAVAAALSSPSSNAPVLGAAREPLQPESGRCPCDAGTAVRDLQGQVHSSTLFGPSGTANCARPGPAWRRSRRDASGGDGADGAPPPRTRPRRSPSGPTEAADDV